MAAQLLVKLVLLAVLSVPRSLCHVQCDVWNPHFNDSESSQVMTNCNSREKVSALGCEVREPVVSWNVSQSDRTVGEMAVDFLLFPDAGSFWISLEHSDATKQDCRSSARFELHSSRMFVAPNVSKTEPKDGNCLKTGREWFWYVYTGCYRLKFFDFKSPQIIEYYSCPQFLETSYKKKPILDREPVLNAQYNFLQSALTLTTDMGPEVGVVQINVKLSGGVDLTLGDDVCKKSGEEEVCCAHVPGQSPTTLCRASKAHTNTECHYDNSSLVCLMNNVQPGNYCMIVTITDDRCPDHPLWSEISSVPLCRWSLQFRANETAPGPDGALVPEDSWTRMLLYWCVAIMCVLVLAGTAVACWMCGRDAPARRPDAKEVVWNPKYRMIANNQGPTEVLLLYALDCDLFMDLMTVFRNSLKKLGFKVHDCFDPECQAKVARGPAQWLRHLLSRPEVKVVVVSSECARRCQAALDSCVPLYYAQPRPFSSLFACALEHIVREGRPEAYEREHHVRFHRFTEERHLLAHVTPLRIYTLPKHFSLLLQSLANRCEAADAEVDVEDNNVFDEPLDRLVRYKTQNPDYLDHLVCGGAALSKAEQDRR
ncbi:uncharacterized protein LOC134542385 [Bacillus rossius redtenbacheri]|uniref:uncharacterized protein LOC134542385 n=1 Tax=Bacillus rossius redtenbacheri TaxID=93214 RepID=UPI002FDD5C2A